MAINVEKYTEQPKKIKRVQLDYEDLVAKLQDDKLDLGQDATNPVTSSESLVGLTKDGLVPPDDFLRVYGYDKNFESSNLNLRSPSVTADPGIQLGQSIDPTSPKESAEEVASVPGLRKTRDIGYESLTPAVTDSDKPELPWSGKKPDLDSQMEKLEFEPAFKGEKIETPTSTFDRFNPSDPFDPLNVPPDRLKEMPGAGAETTVPGQGDSLFDAINYTGRFAPGQEKPASAEDALGLLSNIYGPPSDKIFHDVRNTAAVRAITGVISGLGKAAFGPAILNDPVKLAQNFGVGLAQKIVAGGGGGIGLNPFTIKATLESYKNNWERMGFINQAAAIAYVGNVATGVADIVKTDFSTEKFGNLLGNHLVKVTSQLNLFGDGVKELVGDPVNVAKAVNNIIHRGSIGGTSTDLNLLHGRVSHSFDERGKATTPGWMTPVLGFSPLSTGISLARGAISKLGGDDAQSQNAWNEVNSAVVGGARIDISSGGENETDTKVYANGKTAHLNLHVRNLADENYDLFANTTNLKGDWIIGDLSDVQQNSMFVGPNPFTGQNTSYRVGDINKQMLATWKGMGGKGNRPTADQYNALVQEKIKPNITMFNQAVNLAAGTTIVPEDKLHLANSRNVEQARDFFNGTHRTVDEEGNVVFDAEEEREAEEGRAMTAYEKEYEIVEHSKQLGTLPPPAPAPLPVFRPPQRQPVYSSDPVDPPSTGYEDFTAW